MSIQTESSGARLTGSSVTVVSSGASPQLAVMRI